MPDGAPGGETQAPPSAEGLALELEELRRTGNDPAVAQTCMRLAQTHAERGALRQAYPLFEEALQLFEAQDDRANRLLCLKAMAGLCYRQGAWHRALDLYHQALRFLENSEDQAEFALIYSQIGSVYQGQGDWENAEASYAESLKIRERLGDTGGMALLYNNLGTVFGRQRR
ncbi:MAG TPA: tetratricopeptide repeat protein, partial [Candidatus Acidoferrum sp.]|nr:tetratricopeptide repeat protein [Candidatus Acidoferrum sp.]